MLDSLFIINFKKYIQNILKQNKQIQNCEFRLKSPHTLEMICIRDDLSLFEIFYKIEISSIASNDIDIKNPNIFNHDDYYFSIDFVKCFQIVEKNDNEQMAIYLFQLLSFVLRKFGIMNKLRHYDMIFNFNEKFLKDFMQKIFEKKWYHLMKVILDLAYKKPFIYLNDAEFKTETKQLNSSLLSIIFRMIVI
jgi:phage anti-repressor protein